MLTFKQNYLIIVIITIANIFFGLNSANGQTKQEFYNLLPAYEKARFEYSLAEQLGQTQEEIYWFEQYVFYQEKLEDIINMYDEAARKDPQTYCLTALELYEAYSRASSDTVILNSIDNSTFYFQLGIMLQTYCARFDIYYNPNQRM